MLILILDNNMKDENNAALALHVAGATVKHNTDFSNLKILENNESLSQDFINKYVISLYMKRIDNVEFREYFLTIKDSVDNEVVAKLLGDFNWRTRSVGADFAAIYNMNEYEDNIGKLLLRSDVCYAGRNYCLALASFSSTVAINYLQQYLEYYLRQPDLWFDQDWAMAALSYIGINKGEDLLTPYMDLWNEFIINKPSMILADSMESFNLQMLALNKLKLITINQ